MLKPGQKNNYHNFLKKKREFAEKVKNGKIFNDTDKDGLSDYEEQNLYGTDPKNPDSDNDGMKDGAEVKKGRNPLGPGKLKDLFIPHAGNDYLPHSLKPKRLLFHALSVIAIKGVVVAFIMFYPLSAWLSPDLAFAEAKKIIELTNNLRQIISLPALTENRQLTQAAWQKVQDMAINQYFAHVSPAGLSLKNWLKNAGYKYSLAGENLAVGFSKPEDVVEAWKNSPTHYENIKDANFKEIGVALTDGKLNQIDTIFIAQYFAAPALAVAGPVKETVSVETAAPAPIVTKPAVTAPIPQTAVEGEKTVVPAPELIKPAEPAPAPAVVAALPTEETVAPKEITIDQTTAVLSIKSDPLNDSRILQAEVSLPQDTVFAEVIVNGLKISLNKILGSSNAWQGVVLLSADEEKNITDPLVPASLTIKNSAGQIAYGKIDWDEIKTLKTTPLEQYELFKASPAKDMWPILNLSGIYFKLLLAIAFIAVVLNIFIEIRKQHPHIIFYSFAFLGLLLAMIIF